MKNLFFTNAFFEDELLNRDAPSPTVFLEKHPLYFQLHYLSLLTASANEIPLLAENPSPDYLNHLKDLGFSIPSYALLSNLPNEPLSLSSWGPSPSLAKWALQNNISYSIPSLDLVTQIQSKAFCFQNFPQLEHSKLVSSEEELLSWWDSFKGPKVLKTLFGSSGRGHLIVLDEQFEKAKSFFQRHSPPLIAQPWVERVFDFSTQWEIKQDGSFSCIGSTICENSSKGTYLKSVVGPSSILFKDRSDFLEEHIKVATQAVKHLSYLSFFGNVGFDAFVYNDSNGKMKLFPLVEINARKTMGWAALQIAKALSINTPIAISYSSHHKHELGLLPSCKGSHTFAKQLVLEVDPVCI